MRKIVQIDESEYDQLVDKANLNEKQIEERAIALYEEKGVAEVEITVRTDDNTYSTRYFKCNGFVWYKDNRFFIPENLRNRLKNFIVEFVRYKVNQDYEKPERLVRYYNKKVDLLNYARYILYAVAASGWAVAAVLFVK